MYSNSKKKKCRLCSKLFSWLNPLLRQLGLIQPDCRSVFLRASDNQRVRDVYTEAQNCSCESSPISRHSPGIVQDNEILALFIFSPMNVDRKGRVKPAVFSHVHEKGRSVQRDDVADVDELVKFSTDFLRGKDDRAWKGVLLGNVGLVRKLINFKGAQSVCVYDTAEQRNPAHAELFQSDDLDEADRVELRAELYDIFNGENPVTPENYRSGHVWREVPIELQQPEWMPFRIDSI